MPSPEQPADPGRAVVREIIYTLGHDGAPVTHDDVAVVRDGDTLLIRAVLADGDHLEIRIEQSLHPAVRAALGT